MLSIPRSLQMSTHPSISLQFLLLLLSLIHDSTALLSLQMRNRREVMYINSLWNNNVHLACHTGTGFGLQQTDNHIKLLSVNIQGNAWIIRQEGVRAKGIANDLVRLDTIGIHEIRSFRSDRSRMRKWGLWAGESQTLPKNQLQSDQHTLGMVNFSKVNRAWHFSGMCK